MRHTLPTSVAVATVAVAVVLGAAGCSTNPATGKTQLNLFSEAQEIELGRQNDQQIVAQMGLYGDEGLQRYVDGLGQRLARASERPDLPWTFRVVDDPVVNAFALPGGFVYVTRGILAHLRSEDELVGVLGHEIGHVTARHSVNQLSKAQLASVGLGIAMVASPEARQFGDLAQTGLGVLFLKFGRDDERQADDLGFRYMADAGYTPAAMGEVFTVLSRVSSESDGSRLPSWLSTHPDPGARAERVTAHLEELPPEVASGEARVEPYLERLQGIEFGPDPREGFFVEGRFYHPELAFSFAVPPEWNGVNQRQAVYAVSPNQDAVLVFTLEPEGKDPRAAAQEFFGQPGIEQAGDWLGRASEQPTLSGSFRAVVDQQGNQLHGGVAWSTLGGRTFRFLGYSRPGDWGRHARTLAGAAASFRPLTDRRLLSVEPRRIELVRVPERMSLADFDRRYPSTVPREKLALLNHVEPDGVLPAGFLAKRVTGVDPATLVD